MGSKSPESEKQTSWPKVKKENSENEIKEFAETAMNELLGWYGYDTLAREDTALLRSLPRPLPSSLRARGLQSAPSSRKPPSDPPDSDEDDDDDIRKDSVSPSGRDQNSLGKESMAQKNNICGWCTKPLPTDTCQTLTTAGGTFCSELCFAQSRRASFKKNKTCDWCRHVRHTVSYVDFQDGASQLQFCSDKCLNQYKMHIFCREAQAHLELHPHVHSAGDSSVQQGLITPDLWMRNCRSPSTDAKTPTPPASPVNNNNNNEKPTDLSNPPQTSPLPLISVAHPSKLMYSNNEKIPEEKNMRNKNKKRRNSQCSSTVISNKNTNLHQNVSPSLLRNKVTCEQQQRNISPERVSPEFRPKNIPFPSNLFDGNGSLQPNLFFGPRPQFFPPDPRLFGPNLNVFPPPPHMFPGAPRLLQLPVSSVTPPVTVLVPYPIIIPVPLPIPLPVPLPDFLKAATNSMAKENISAQQNGTIVDNNLENTNQKNNVSTSKEHSSDKNKIEIEIDTNQHEKEIEKCNDTIESIPTSMRPLRKRKRIIPRETKDLGGCKTRKLKFVQA